MPPIKQRNAMTHWGPGEEMASAIDGGASRQLPYQPAAGVHTVCHAGGPTAGSNEPRLDLTQRELGTMLHCLKSGLFIDS